MAVKELRERQAKLVADARAKLDEITADTNESRAKEIEVEYDAIMADYDRLEERAKREETLEAREAIANAADERRPQGENRETSVGAVQVEVPETDDEVRAAYGAYLRYGLQGMSAEQRNVIKARAVREQRVNPQGTTSGPDGGYLVPTGFMAELIKSLKAWGPMLDPGVTREMVTAMGNIIPWPTMDDTSNTGAIIAENTQVSTSEVTFGTKAINAYKYTSGVVLVSSELLNDSALNVEQIVRDAMAERIGRIVNTHLTTGDAASKPNGIMTAAGAGYTAASATAIVFDDLIELFHSVDPAYRSDPSVKWMFNDSTFKALRKLKDGEGEYIWQAMNVATGTPATILDKPFEVNQAVASIATGAKSVAFGAFNRYVVRKVNEFSIRRLVERYADYDQTGFIGFGRFDGNLLDAGAVKVLTHP